METTRPTNHLLLWIILAAFLACAILLFRNGGHADTNHADAQSVRALIDSNARHDPNRDNRTGLSLYYSQLHGTLLVLLRPGNGQAAGWVFKITEQTLADGVIPLGHRTYERTCFTAPETYWLSVLARDHYLPLATAISIPAIAGVLTTALGIVILKLRHDRRNHLADRLQSELERRR